MLKVGILGIGNLGKNFLKSFNNSKRSELVVVCDKEKEKLGFVKDIIPGLKMTTNIEKFLSYDIDMVILCTPTYENPLLVEKIMKKSINVLCSIPIAPSIKQAESIVQATKENKSKFMAAHIIDYFSSHSQFKSILSRKKIGEVGFLRTSIGGGYPDSYNNWLDKDQLGGGVIVNLGIHHFHYIISLFGPVSRVYCKRGKILEGSNKKDYCLAVVKFKNKNIVHMELSWAYPDGQSYISKLDAFGTNGQVTYDDSKKKPIKIYQNQSVKKNYDLYIDENPLAGNPYSLVVESFINYIEGNIDIPIKTESSVYALKVALSALESANNGSVVYLD